MRTALLALSIGILAALSSCGGDDSSTGGATTVTIAPSTAAPSPSTSPAAESTTAIASPAAPVASCQGLEVEFPSIVALSAVDGGPCWSALPNENAYIRGIADERLLVASGACPGGEPLTNLVALDAQSGQEVWRFTPEPTPEDTFSDARARIGGGGGVVVVNSGTTVKGLELGTGAQLWTFPMAGVLADGTDLAVVAAGEASAPNVVVLDRRTGAERWRTDPGGFASAAADATTVLVTAGPSTVAFDAATGARRWEAPFTQASDTSAVRIVDGVATGASEAVTVGYDIANGQRLWESPNYPVQSPEPSDSNVYVTLEDGSIGALDARAGTVRWQLEAPSIEAGPGLVTTITEEDTGELQAIDPATGQVRWTRAVAETGLPASRDVTPAGAAVIRQNVLPTGSGVFFAYGNCLGS